MGYIGTDINYGNLSFQTGEGDGAKWVDDVEKLIAIERAKL